MNEAAEIKPYGRLWLADFGLDETVLHANHGSYGAVPSRVFEAQTRIREELRRNPAGFFRRRYPGLVRQAAARVTDFLGGAESDWVFVENTTAAANAVVANVPLGPGDEILTTDHCYGAVRKTIAHRCAETGVRLVEAPLVLPVADAGAIPWAIANGINPRTRLVVFDHIASPCGIVFPVAEICALCRSRGVPVFIDGAHSPGNIGVDVPGLGADFFAGNAHKWLCAPPGAAMLWCRADWQDRIHPAVISHGYGMGLTAEFDWIGTRDPTAWLSVPAAIDFHLHAGGHRLRRRNRELAFAAASHLAEEFGTTLAAPKAMQCSMATVRLPINARLSAADHDRLHIAIEQREKAVVSVTSAGGSLWLRLSAAIYSEIDDLVEAGRRARKVLEDMHGP